MDSKMMELERKVAGLEFVNDQLVAELRYVNELLRAVGFEDGLETVKGAAKELQQQYFEEEEAV
jgi:hypothetical protein